MRRFIAWKQAVVNRIIKRPWIVGVLQTLAQPFNPEDMFTSGEQGWVYDLADFSTLFQDSAGTTPVTAVGQPVGLVLDKSKGLVLGAEEPNSGLASGWDSADPRFTYGADSVSWVGGGGANVTSSKTYLTSSNFNDFVELRFTISGYSGSADAGVASGTLSQFAGGGGAIITTTVSANGSYVFRGYWRGGGSTNGRNLALLGRGTNSFTISNISVKKLPGNHASQSATGMRPLLQQDGNGKYYLKGDGIDDFMQTSSIDFTGTDKLAVWAGVRKLTDATTNTFLEFGTNSGSVAGTFGLFTTINGYRWRAGGTILVDPSISAGFIAPVTTSLTGIDDISGDSAVLRADGLQVASSAADQGTGNFGNYPMYFLSRAGTSLFFNGHLYSSVCLGRAATAEELAKTEAWVAERTGVTLP